MTPYYDEDGITIYHGDCREIMTGAAAGFRSQFDAVITDPPYGDTSLVWDRWPDGWVRALNGVRQMWCFGSMRMWLDRHYEFESQNWTYAQEIVWEKHNGSGFHADRFKRVHELAVHWYRGPWADLYIDPQTTPDATARQVRRKQRPAHTGYIDQSSYVSEDGGPRLMRSVLEVRSCHGHALHPTEKPIGIIEPLIRYSVPVSGCILDPFTGSGAILAAARANGRRAVGIEADERYCEIAAKRLAQGVLDFGAVS